MDAIPLEPGPEQRSALEASVSAFIERFVDERATAPVSSEPIEPSLVAKLLDPPSGTGVDIEHLMTLVAAAVNSGFDTASGRFFSYIPSGGIYSAALGGYLGAVVNRYTAGSHAAPGMVAIEESVIGWMTDLFGLGLNAGGLLLSGGSMANLTAIVTARSQLGSDFAGGVLYLSDRSHHSMAKGARIAGIGNERVRLIPSDDLLRLDTNLLEAAIESDLQAGLRPMMIAATAGTTDTGAIDPLAICGEIAARYQTWLHVDAAYGGFFQLTDRGLSSLDGIEHADSITVDAHKSLFLPFGIGGLLVRNVAHLVDAHEGEGAYMQDVADGDLPHYMSMGPEQTRPNRGLPLWLALNLHGVDAFRETLDLMLDLAEHAAARLASIPGIELVTSPQLSIVAFRSAAGNQATSRLLQAINDTGQAHMSSTTINGIVWIRLALLSQRTTAAIVDHVIDLVGAIAPSAERQ